MLLAPFIARIRRKIWIWVLALIGGILGVLPDLLGTIGTVILRDGSALYSSAHFGSIKSVMQYFPMYWLHLLLDSYMHDPKRAWHGIYLRPTLEILLWVVNIILIVWFYRIWRRNVSKRASLPRTEALPAKSSTRQSESPA